MKAFDGIRVLEPWVVYLKPMHENPEQSWFETTGRVAGDVVPEAAPRSCVCPTAARILKRAVLQLLGRARGRPPTGSPSQPSSEQQKHSDQRSPQG